MNDIELRVPWGLSDDLRRAAFAGGQFEPVVFGLISSARVSGKHLLLLKSLISVPSEAYLRPDGHGARWSPRFTIEVLNRALRERLGVVIFHAHPVSGRVRLSPDDDRSGRQLLDRFQEVQPDRPHATVVLGLDEIDGLVLLPGAQAPSSITRLRSLGEWLDEFEHADPGPLPAPSIELSRQALAVGGIGEYRLRKAAVAVVGLGGGGSHVVQQLAHMGIGEIIGLDGDRSERTNRSRLVGLRWLDVLLRRHKTAVMTRLVRQINASVRFTAVPNAVPSLPALEALKRCDIIVGCVDNLHSRADLQSIAWRYLIPYIDIGIRIQMDKEIPPGSPGAIRAIGGNVYTFLPGDFCAFCVDFISPEKLDAETGGRPRSYLDDVMEPQVVSFNGIVASQAASEVLQLILGYAPGERARFKKFDGFQGTLTEWVVTKKQGCETCNRELGAGEPIWSAV